MPGLTFEPRPREPQLQRQEATEEKSLALQIGRADVLASSVTVGQTRDGGGQLQLLAAAGWQAQTRERLPSQS